MESASRTRFPYPSNRGCHCKAFGDFFTWPMITFPYPSNRGCHCKGRACPDEGWTGVGGFHTLLIAGVTARPCTSSGYRCSGCTRFHTLLIAGVTASQSRKKEVKPSRSSFPYPSNRGCHCKILCRRNKGTIPFRCFHTLLIAGVTARKRFSSL